MALRLAIIANPVAGRGHPFRKIQDYVRNWNHPNWDARLLTTQAPGHAGELARELAESPPDLLAVCGGDGTFNEVVSCLPQPLFPLAILPCGTANVLARELRLPLDPVKSLQIALKRNIRHVDVGVMRGGDNRSFMFVAGIGFDADAVYKARPALKSAVGMAAYAVAVAECLIGYKFPTFTLTANGRNYQATSCLICNARSYGGGMVFCPEADMTDGLLDVLVIEGIHRVGLAGFLLSAWCGVRRKHEWVQRFRTKEIKINGPSSVRIETDGELAGTLPAEFFLSEKTFPLVVP